MESLRLTREEGLQQDTEDEQHFKMQESEEDHSKETEKEEEYRRPHLLCSSIPNTEKHCNIL